jgi:hypothetical protein
MSFLKWHDLMWKKSNDVVRSLQKQAPGAKMVGQFAVKFATTEVSKVVSRLTNKPAETTSDDSPNDPTS